jgi:hypothetical protein
MSTRFWRDMLRREDALSMQERLDRRNAREAAHERRAELERFAEVTPRSASLPARPEDSRAGKPALPAPRFVITSWTLRL